MADVTDTILNLTLEEAEGQGTMSLCQSRLATAKEEGRFQTKIKLSFRVSNIDEARRAQAMYPGAVEVYRQAHGEGSDGKRKADWTPSNPDCRVILSDVERGVVAYEGTAELKLGRLVVSEKSAFVEQQLQIPMATLEEAQQLLGFLGRTVAANVTRRQKALPFPSSEDEEGELPPEAGDASPVPEEGHLVTVNYEGEIIHGVCMAVEDDNIVTIREVGGKEDLAYPLDAVDAAVPICGKSGGKPASVLKKYAAAARKEDQEPSAERLILAIATAQGRGLIERREEGFPVTDEVIELALSMGREGAQLSVVN